MPICAADKEGGPKQVFVSKGTGTNHTVTEWMTGYWSCTCPDWRMRRNLYIEHYATSERNHHCKHILSELDGTWNGPGPDSKPSWSGYTPEAQEYESRTRRMQPPPPSRNSQPTGRAISLGDEEV